MRSNPGKAMTIYDIPGIVKDALPKAFTPSNISAGFRVTGIHPYNKDIFSEVDFRPAQTTDQPLIGTTDATKPTQGRLQAN